MLKLLLSHTALTSDMQTCAWHRYGFLGEARERLHSAAIGYGYEFLFVTRPGWYGAIDRLEPLGQRVLNGNMSMAPEEPWRRSRMNASHQYQAAASLRRYR